MYAWTLRNSDMLISDGLLTNENIDHLLTTLNRSHVFVCDFLEVVIAPRIHEKPSSPLLEQQNKRMRVAYDNFHGSAKQKELEDMEESIHSFDFISQELMPVLTLCRHTWEHSL